MMLWKADGGGGEVMLWQVVPGALLSRVERAWLRAMAQAVAEERGGHVSDVPVQEVVQDVAVIVNIGIFKGASMHYLRAGAPDAVLVGIDVGLGQIHAADVLRTELICSDSRLVSWERPIDLLFVDGGHSYEVVRSDIETFGAHVVAGGVMAFHDYARSERYLAERKRDRPSRPPLGVRRAVDELCTESQGWEVWCTVDSIKAFRKVAQ